MTFFKLKLSVTSYVNAFTETNKNSHTFYSIEIKTENNVYFIEKRFREFELLHNNLKKLSKSNFIDFQNKHFYTRTSKTFEYRRSILDEYLKKLIDFYAGNYPKELLNFIQYNELKNINVKIEDKLSEKNEQIGRIPLIDCKGVILKDLVFLQKNQDDIIIKGVNDAFYL